MAPIKLQPNPNVFAAEWSKQRVQPGRPALDVAELDTLAKFKADFGLLVVKEHSSLREIGVLDS